jgi:rare lipoprotein A
MVAVIRGRSTASGKRFDILAPTAAHHSLPFGAVLLVENLANGRTIELRITDRGPYVQGRIIGLWLAAAQRLGLEQQGVGLVGLTILSPALPSLIASGR